MSSIIGAKAISMVANGRVVERPHARVFAVEGSTGAAYVVVIGARPVDDDPERRSVTCTCPAGQRERACSHAYAAHLLIAREREAVDA